MPRLNAVDYQIMLWRADGSDFSERDRLLLAMVRPHLVAIRDATFKRKGEPPPLASRQRQLISLIAAGLTSRSRATSAYRSTPCASTSRTSSNASKLTAGPLR